MSDQKLPKNCLLQKTRDLFDIKLFQETIKKFDINEKCCLIVDKRGAMLLNNFLSLTEVLNNGILSIDSIYRKRHKYKSYSAIYLISGKKEILAKIMDEDFIDEENRWYKNCHLFIIDDISDELYDLMAVKKFLKYIKSLKQISIKYVTMDKNLFSFGSDINFNSIYSLFNDNNEINNLNISKLYNICQALNMYPNILYCNLDKKCQLLAENLNKKLKKYFSKRKKEGILLITSRLLDFLAPLKFNIIYQNLLLESFKDKNTNYCNKIILDKVKEKACYILDYKDELYNKYKNRYYQEVQNLVNEDFKDFKNSEVGKAMINIDKEVAAAAENFLKYKSLSQKISQHFDLCLKLRDNLNNRHISDLLDAQETILSKMRENGKKISDKDIISLMKNNKNKFNKNDLLRLICLIKYEYQNIDIEDICETNITQKDKKIINFIRKEENYLNQSKLDELNKSIIEYREKNNYNTKEENDNKEDKRYNYIKESQLTTICDMCCKDKLPNDLFTFVEKPENLKFQKKKYAINIDNVINEDNEEEIKQNLILFNLGGLSYYEISSLERGTYLGQYNMNLILGGNKIYNHEEYISEIKDYIEKKNKIVKTEEKDDLPKFENKDSKIQISDNISYGEKGSKEKMRKKGKKNNEDNDLTQEDEDEDMK